MKIKNNLSKFLSAFSIIALLVLLVCPQPTNALSLIKVADVMSREAVSQKSTHLITFKTPSIIAAAGTIAINFSTFTGTVAVSDVQICHGSTTGLEHGTPTVSTGPTCGGGETVTGSGGASTVWQAVYATTTLTLTAPTGTMTYPIAANDIITIYVSATNITNPSSTSTPNITITNSNGDSGSFTVAILDSDQVGVSATVAESLSFSIKAGTTNTGSAPYSVPLGTLTTASASGSGASSVPYIWANLSTNATGGMVVTVVSANGALKSTSTPADTIPSTTGTMTAGSAGYGICIISVSQASGATLTKGTNFPSSTCSSSTPTGNTVSAVTTSPQQLVTASGLINTGVAQISLDAENTATTPAHTDYSDTLTFIGTATY